MIDLKQAVQVATTFARDLFVDEDLRHLRVEEVELPSDQRLWNITLGWVGTRGASEAVADSRP
jgi:hypothetical protein